MERTDEATAGTEKTGLKGTWLVLAGVAGKYIIQTLKSREQVLDLQSIAGRLNADDCFEFSSNLQVRPALDPKTQQQVGINFSKQTIAYRVDAILHKTSVSFSLIGSMLYFLDDMKEADAAQYKDIIQDAMRMGEEMHTQRVEAQTGLITRPSTVLPTGARGR